MAKIKLVIFDCDGVLIDSEVLSMNVWIKLLARHQVEIDAGYFFEHFLGRSFEHVKAKLTEDFNFTVTDTIAEQFATQLKAVFTTHLTTTPYLLEILPRLNVPYALATSSSPERTAVALSTTGLNEWFAAPQIFTASMVKHGKPAPDLFLHVAASFHLLPAQCLVIEDSAPGLAAARAAGMQWRHYTGGSHMPAASKKAQDSLADWREFTIQFPQLMD